LAHPLRAIGEGAKKNQPKSWQRKRKRAEVFSHLPNFKKSKKIRGIGINRTGKIHLKLVKASEVITQLQIGLHQFEDERFRTKIFPNRIQTSERFTVVCFCVTDLESA